MYSDKIMKPTRLKLLLNIFGPYWKLHVCICATFTYGEKCGQSEYRSAADECCPMCAMGSVVMKDCDGDYSTTCKPCAKGTFMNEPNGLHTCFQCKICENGFYISQDCTTMQDTVCGDGFYCIRYSDEKRDCSLAIKHTKCKPGEQIKTPGTKASDTVCESCSPGFYSPEGVNCSKWTEKQWNLSKQWKQRGASPLSKILNKNRPYHFVETFLLINHRNNELVS
ncbi:tumor necrosis factor receptor superfamily member 14-like isoform X8 [Tachysurus fulvidraco]|uniref:tumor necrosis factor receptor superfamily member 14-like isoform X8 n=1 Tax=Tachysurus fulvidraco TaxID=1234273 RepID=UPI001FEE210C|nr:tumor necrosis factor receptor superfamily member 14-like isoform X8 [Tachysurus fulvidraco]